MEKKLFCVIITKQEDWDNPFIYHIRASSPNKATEVAMAEIGKSLDEIEEDDEMDYIILEVSDIDVLEEK